MPLSSRYQVVLLEPGGDARRRFVAETLRRRVQELGLDPGQDLAFFDERSLAGLDRRAPIAAAYFGGKARSDEATAAVERLRALEAFLLPVVLTLRGYTQQVPDALHEINGFAPDRADAALESVAGRLLEELGLLREKRRVFISYRRDKSSKVAEQLYHALDARSFDVFLDTHSVTTGTIFQSVLWDRMSDMDLVVLLDAPGTLDSRWVAEELARAALLGLGVLQVVWPGHTRARETEACTPEYVEAEDFLRGKAAQRGGLALREAALGRVVAAVESLRARSMAARRSRLVSELCRAARRAGLSTAVQPGRHVDLVGRRGRTRRVFPIVGFPDSVLAHDACEACRRRPVEPILLYDPAWMLPRRERHLKWLGKQLSRSVRMIRTTELDRWL